MQVEFSNSFLKNLKKLDNKLQDVFKKKIKQIAIDPTIGIPLKHNLRGYYKMRVLVYRIIYSFDESSIYFYALNHRKNVYKKL